MDMLNKDSVLEKQTKTNFMTFQNYDSGSFTKTLTASSPPPSEMRTMPKCELQKYNSSTWALIMYLVSA